MLPAQLLKPLRLLLCLRQRVKTEICARLPLEKAAEGLAQYAANMTAGKVLLVPNKK
jgi:hypothetical protein